MKKKSKTRIATIIGAVLAGVFPILGILGIEISAEDQTSIIAGIVALVGVIMAALGESPVQDKIDAKK